MTQRGASRRTPRALTAGARLGGCMSSAPLSGDDSLHLPEFDDPHAALQASWRETMQQLRFTELVSVQVPTP